MLSLCALLGNVEITVCPGEVTSTQELRAGDVYIIILI